MPDCEHCGPLKPGTPTVSDGGNDWCLDCAEANGLLDAPECPEHPGTRMVFADGLQAYHDRKTPHWRCEVWVGGGVCGHIIEPDARATKGQQ